MGFSSFRIFFAFSFAFCVVCEAYFLLSILRKRLETTLFKGEASHGVEEQYVSAAG